jgi:hypothetical protein
MDALPAIAVTPKLGSVQIVADVSSVDEIYDLGTCRSTDARGQAGIARASNEWQSNGAATDERSIASVSLQ